MLVPKLYPIDYNDFCPRAISGTRLVLELAALPSTVLRQSRPCCFLFSCHSKMYLAKGFTKMTSYRFTRRETRRRVPEAPCKLSGMRTNTHRTISIRSCGDSAGHHDPRGTSPTTTAHKQVLSAPPVQLEEVLFLHHLGVCPTSLHTSTGTGQVLRNTANAQVGLF